MGYTFFSKFDIRTKQELVERIIQDYSNNDFSFQKKCVKGSVMYALMKNPKGEFFNVVFLIKQYKSELGYKTMDESEGPYYYDCPKSYLNAATVEDKSGWRQKCFDYQKLKKRIGHLPNGITIVFHNNTEVEFLYVYNKSCTQFVGRNEEGKVFRYPVQQIKEIKPYLKIAN